MKTVLLTGLGLLLLLAPAVGRAQAGSGEFHLKRRGIDLTISIAVANGKVQKIAYSEWTPVNRSAHECGLEAARDNGDSKWTEKGDTTTVSVDGDEGSSVSIRSRADDFLITSACNDTKVLFVKTGDKYVGRIVK